MERLRQKVKAGRKNRFYTLENFDLAYLLHQYRGCQEIRQQPFLYPVSGCLISRHPLFEGYCFGAALG